MMVGMKKKKILQSWVARGAARSRFDDDGRPARRRLRVNRYGFIDGIDLLAWLFQEKDCYSYVKFRHALCSQHIAHAKAAARRPRYYEAENARRRALAAERRKICTRSTLNACPTREAILAAWNSRRNSHAAAIRFGSLLEDLECYLDNSLRRDENGVIIGRNAGIKGWLFDNLPDLFDKYTTAMRYKAAAKKLKQVTELRDPTPAEVALPREDAEQREAAKCDYGADESADGAGEVYREGASEAYRKEAGEGESPTLAVLRARAIWLEVVKGIGPSATALQRRLDALTDPARVEDANMLAAWREKYANEITERTKKRWWRRLVAKVRSGAEIQLNGKRKPKRAGEAKQSGEAKRSEGAKRSGGAKRSRGAKR
jgi:hypothetical protein